MPLFRGRIRPKQAGDSMRRILKSLSNNNNNENILTRNMEEELKRIGKYKRLQLDHWRGKNV